MPVNVDASPSISFEFISYTLSDGRVGGTPVLITVTDPAANFDTSVSETVDVTVTSDSDLSGISLTLNETGPNTGIFTNSNMIFTSGISTLLISDTVTITLANSTANTSSTSVDSFDIVVRSSSDSSGLSITLNESDINSGIFEGGLSFTSGTSSGNSLKVSPGDIVSIPGSIGVFTNILIVPNPDPSVNALEASVGDTITATYDSVSATSVIASIGSPGGGGGGISRAGLVVDSSSGTGAGCPSDCTPPTLGVLSSGYRIVEKGFSYNGNPVDVELFYTSYPLITVDIGVPNIAILKVYENSGTHFIRHVELGFGLGSGEVISQSKAVIMYDIEFDGTTKTSVFDPDNVLEDVSVTSEAGKCNTLDVEDLCLILYFEHTFRAPLDFNMVGTNVWDAKRNGWQNYYNHGIEIVGNSLNPPKQIKVLDRSGYQYTISLFNRTVAIDEQERIWYNAGAYWITDYVVPIRDDPITKHGIDRNNNKFQSYLQNQTLIAEQTLRSLMR